MDNAAIARSLGTIVVVDDEETILRVVGRNLLGSGYTVVTARDGEEALKRIEVSHPDLIILDLMLPKMSGLEVCRRVRAESSVPILILSAVGEETQKVAALDLGADDYLTKPFGIEELLARVRAMLRRAGQSHDSTDTPAVFTYGDLHLDFGQRAVIVRSQPVKLTVKEYDLLAYLVRHAGRLVTYRDALLNVWGAEYATERHYLHVFVNQLRQKLEADPAHPQYILTEPGMGYRFGQLDM